MPPFLFGKKGEAWKGTSQQIPSIPKESEPNPPGNATLETVKGTITIGKYFKECSHSFHVKYVSHSTCQKGIRRRVCEMHTKRKRRSSHHRLSQSFQCARSRENLRSVCVDSSRQSSPQALRMRASLVMSASSSTIQFFWE